MTLPPDIDDRKDRARVWFENLRDQLHAAFEALEDEASPDLYPGAAGRFERTAWQRTDHIPARKAAAA
jgi:coproporphyrinogen III oxidase